VTELLKTWRWPIIGGLVGLIFAVLIISIGFFKTLMILIFVILSIMLGYYFKKTDILSNLFKLKEEK
jgi:uncharacterized membrane protein